MLVGSRALSSEAGEWMRYILTGMGWNVVMIDGWMCQ